MNYFELFEIQESFNPDAAIVKKKFYELSRKFHPDFFTDAEEDAQQHVLEQSALVNKAFKTFSNKQETIKYVLQQKSLLQEEEKFALPNDFLMEMMELNEAIMDAKMEEDEAAINNLKNQIAQFEKDIYEPLTKILEAAEINSVSQEELLQVKTYYFKQKYLERMKELFEK